MGPVKVEMKRLLDEGYLAADDQATDFGGVSTGRSRLTTRGVAALAKLPGGPRPKAWGVMVWPSGVGVRSPAIRGVAEPAFSERGVFSAGAWTAPVLRGCRVRGW